MIKKAKTKFAKLCKIQVFSLLLFSLLSLLALLLLEAANLLVPVPLALNVASSIVHLNAFTNLLLLGFSLSTFFLSPELPCLIIFLNKVLESLILSNSLIFLVKNFLFFCLHNSRSSILQLFSITRLLQQLSLLVLQMSANSLIDLFLSAKLLFKISDPVSQFGLFFEIFTVLAWLTTFNLAFKQLSFEFRLDFSDV